MNDRQIVVIEVVQVCATFATICIESPHFNVPDQCSFYDNVSTTNSNSSFPLTDARTLLTTIYHRTALVFLRIVFLDFFEPAATQFFSFLNDFCRRPEIFIRRGASNYEAPETIRSSRFVDIRGTHRHFSPRNRYVSVLRTTIIRKEARRKQNKPEERLRGGKECEKKT